MNNKNLIAMSYNNSNIKSVPSKKSNKNTPKTNLPLKNMHFKETTSKQIRKSKVKQQNKLDMAPKNVESNLEVTENPIQSNKKLIKIEQLREKLKRNLKEEVSSPVKVKVKKEKSLRERMLERLKSARFRFINEEMYKSSGTSAQKVFTNNPDSFKAYHDGYRQQVKRWPLNPLDNIIKAIKKL